MSHTRSWVSGSVESIYNQFSELTEMIRDVRTADEFRVGIHELPLTHPEPDKLSLYKLKGVLDELVSSEVAGMIKFVDDEIKSRSAGSPLKPARKPKTTRR